MAKTTEEIERFIELRASGLSFDKIAEQTGTSKPTLLKWNSQYGREIEQAQYFELNSLLAQYGLMRRQRVEAFSKLLGTTLQELGKRATSEGLSRLSTDKLLDLALSLEHRIERETEGKKLEFSSARDMDWVLASYVEVD